MRNRLLIVIIINFVILACSMAPVLGGKISPATLIDGQYEGKAEFFPDKASVSVVIEDGQIVDCKVTGWSGVIQQTNAETIIPNSIVKKQSTDVDAISGATIFSRTIMNAAQDAIDKATIKHP